MLSPRHLPDTADHRLARRRVGGGVPGLQVADLNSLGEDRQRDLLRQIAETVQAVWGRCTEDFHDVSTAERVLRRRLGASDEALFVALDEDGLLMGTASIGRDDFYEDFSRANGVAPGYVGRDLHTEKRWRGVVVDGLKVWEHLLEARLNWIARRGGAQLTVYTEPSDIDLPALYERAGAIVLRTGLDHRELGRGTITMLGYPVQEGLDRLAAIRHRRRAGA